ncbi:MAG: haloacid dehalogenase-like hydrolase [Nitrososphaerota archaeon]|nr:haloacid dehalogenase-like hydrolase [Candidatus Bathyarchaeota archaeon]MDW8049266.1 haloacid dehalogenase-like hydrolase [Nitrososphaerota archaeon]
MSGASQYKLIAFDVEGILIPEARFLFFEVAWKLGIKKFILSAFFGLLYKAGFLSLKRAVKLIYRLFKGMHVQTFISFFEQVPFLPDAEMVISDLKKNGWKIAFISSSVPVIALKKLNERFKADYLQGPEIGLDGDCLTGEIWGEVLETEGKALALKRILSNNIHVNPFCVGVADDRNNLPMLEICNIKIAFNADIFVTQISDYIIRESLFELTEFLQSEMKERRVGRNLSPRDIIRELIHMSGFILPFLCISFFDRYYASSIVFLASTLYAVSEIERLTGRNVPIISRITTMAAGKFELYSFVSSPLFYAFAIIGALLFYSETISYVSITVLTLGDSFATLFGKLLGRTKIPFNKTKNLEGTIFGFIAAFLGCLCFTDPFRAFVASFVGMSIELLPSPVNDNITIPLGAALSIVPTFPKM